MAEFYTLRVNREEQRVHVEPDRTLLSVLRDELDLTGAKYGCGEGQCGACTVLLNGEPTRSCLTSVSDVGEQEITTIEGFEQNGQLHPLQQAFLDDQALQCGYCTCGMIMAAAGLLRETPRPTRDQIVQYMNGNVCRCGVYSRIVAAIERGSAASGEAQQ
jgi:aerobic-type carbon monoxide dehydrogenase small subunit (CoxS/CutS family)